MLPYTDLKCFVQMPAPWGILGDTGPGSSSQDPLQNPGGHPGGGMFALGTD